MINEHHSSRILKTATNKFQHGPIKRHLVKTCLQETLSLFLKIFFRIILVFVS